MVLTATLAMLGILCLHALAGTNPRQEQVICAANLRRIGQAFLAWSEDYGERLPGALATPAGGSSGATTPSTHFRTISNFLSSPRLLTCPATRRPTAPSFISLTDASLSYLLGAHATPEKAFELLSGDIDIEGGGQATCSYLGQVIVTSFSGVRGDPSTYRANWSGTNHPVSGNLLLSDGSVVGGNSTRLRQTLDESRGEGPMPNGQSSVHALIPR